MNETAGGSFREEESSVATLQSERRPECRGQSAGVPEAPMCPCWVGDLGYRSVLEAQLSNGDDAPRRAQGAGRCCWYCHYRSLSL